VSFAQRRGAKRRNSLSYGEYLQWSLGRNRQKQPTMDYGSGFLANAM